MYSFLDDNSFNRQNAYYYIEDKYNDEYLLQTLEKYRVTVKITKKDLALMFDVPDSTFRRWYAKHEISNPKAKMIIFAIVREMEESLENI